MALVVAVILPSAAGLWLCLPSLETLIAPPAYRGPFSAHLAPMLPGLCAFVLTMYAVAPIFQIAKRTAPMVVAALAALATLAALIAILPRDDRALWLAYAQSGALTLGLLVALAFAAASRPQWPRARDLLGALAATAALALALRPLAALPPGGALLALQVTVGATVYGALAWLLDIAGLRRRTGALLGRETPGKAEASKIVNLP
jgi:O-antigen/teichoic acid export membrane protein